MLSFSFNPRYVLITNGPYSRWWFDTYSLPTHIKDTFNYIGCTTTSDSSRLSNIAVWDKLNNTCKLEILLKCDIK